MVKPIFFPSHQQADETEGREWQQIIPGHPGQTATIFPVRNHVPSVHNDDEYNHAEGALGHSLNRAFIASDDDVFWNSTSDNMYENSWSTRETPSPVNIMTYRSTPFSQRNLPIWSCDSVPIPNSSPQSSVFLLPNERSHVAPSEVGCGKNAFEPVDANSCKGAGEEMPPALRDIAAKGKELFWFILSEEVKAREAVDPGALSSLTIPPCTQRTAVLNERSQAGGRTLREIAEAFARSTQRDLVRQRAERVNLQSLTYKTFSDLLFGLFQEGGVTQERVLVLFFFCADMALRALREKLTQRFQQLVDWTSRYITERLSMWVLKRGGWVAVLQDSVNQACKFAIGAICMSVVVVSALVWHRIHS